MARMTPNALIPAAFALLALPVQAQTTAPDYYVNALFAVSTAEQLANFCPEIVFDLTYANATAENVLNQMARDGITGDALTALSGVEDGVASLQAGFVARHDLSAPTTETLCAVARREIAEATAIGAYLKEAEQ